MSHVILNAVEKTYPNGYQAIHGVDMQIEEGEFVVLVGPSGCGKSTLLRMVAGLEDISQGEVHIAGRKVNDLEPSERDIAMVFQNYALYPHMTVYNNMAYGLKNLKTPKAEIQKRVQEAAETLELSELLQRRPKQLSGGQRQRVAMGRAIVRKPTVFLFDEPLSNLDAKLRVQMRVVIKNLQRELATTSLYVTHDQVEAMTMADRLVVLNDGITEQIGTPMELYLNPASQFVAGFIGSPAMNFVDVEVKENGSEFQISHSVNLKLNGTLDVDKAIFGFRPEHMQIADDGELSLSVRFVEHLGAESLLHANIDGAQTEITLRQSGHHQYQQGDTIRATIAADDMHFFSVDSQRRLQV